jgi:hypothetical protein
MIEIKVTVEIPGMTEAINNLAQAIAEKKPVAVEAVKQEAPAVQASAPVAPVAPVEPPVTPAASIQPPVQTAPVPAPTTPVVAPVTPVTPAASAPEQQQAPTAAKLITLNDLSRAGAKLVDAGKMDAVINALKSFGAVAITQLREDQYASFADCLRSLGATI